MDAQWFTGFATLFLAFVALFKDTVLLCIQKPKIDIEFELRPPDCFKTELIHWKTDQDGKNVITGKSKMFYYRLRIINNGKSPAKNVEVTIREIRKKKGNSFDRLDFPLDDNLDWVSSSLILGRPSIMYYSFISPNTFKHCELGHILDPSKRNLVSFEDNKLFEKDETIFSFNVITRYHSSYHLIGPGTYRFKVLVAGGCGYLGSELIELLSCRKDVKIVYTASSKKESGKLEDAKVAFLALPHKESMEIVPTLLPVMKGVIDLSGAYRLKTLSDYLFYYGWEHH